MVWDSSEETPVQAIAGCGTCSQDHRNARSELRACECKSNATCVGHIASFRRVHWRKSQHTPCELAE